MCTTGSVTNRPPSQGQQRSTGSAASEAAAPVATTSWHAPRPRTLRGSQRAISASRGSVRSLSNNESRGPAAWRSSAPIRAATASSDSAPSAIAQRRSEP